MPFQNASPFPKARSTKQMEAETWAFFERRLRAAGNRGG